MPITWLASYPKSGNTWARLFIQAYGTDAELDLNVRTGPIWHDADHKVWGEVLKASQNEMETYPEWEYHCHRAAVLMRFVKHYAREQEGQVWLKTHIPRWTLDGLEMIPVGMTRAAVYIVRDPRDVAISFADHLGAGIDETVEFMGKGNSQLAMDGKRENIGSWTINVGSWTDPCPFPLTVLRYEDMLAEPEDCFAKIVEAFGMEVDPARLRRALARVRFERLRAQEDRGGFLNASPHQARFFRSGTAGAWRDRLTDAQIAQIEQDHGQMMTRMGYALESAKVAA